MSSPYNTRSVPLESGREEKRRKSRIGFIRPGQVETAFMWLLYAALFLLVLLSVLGTFYGRQGRDAPIAAPLRIMSDLRAAPALLGAALGIQFVLTLLQYGARQLSRSDRRWWILYLVALGVSVYYNYYAYWTPLVALVPWYLAGFLIVAGDILPEYIAVRRE